MLALSSNGTRFLVVSQTNSDKFLATTPISSTNFVEMVRPKYDGQSNKMGSGGNPLYAAPKRQVASPRTSVHSCE